jgi:hypothetical protein
MDPFPIGSTVINKISNKKYLVSGYSSCRWKNNDNLDFCSTECPGKLSLDGGNYECVYSENSCLYSPEENSFLKLQNKSEIIKRKRTICLRN